MFSFFREKLAIILELIFEPVNSEDKLVTHCPNMAFPILIIE
jgi:hypothetical protein